MRRAAAYVALPLAAAAVFTLIPTIDLWVSRQFYVPGEGFPLGAWLPLVLLHRAIPWIAGSIFAIAAGAAIWLLLSGRPLWRLDRAALVFIVAATALGPGLLANTLLKDHWGRARPAQVEEFGGPRHFTPALLPARECARNCSFVSGDAALGFSLVVFALLLPAGAGRRRGEALALGFGALVGLARIAQGGHFLSDVVFAGLLVYGSTAVLHWWIIERDGLAAAWPVAHRLAGARGWMWAAAAAGVVVVAIVAVDRPLAWYLHQRDADLRGLFDLTGRLGLTYGYLIVFGLAFVALHWGGVLPRLQPFAAAMRALSAVPAFLLAALAASGIVVDVLKVATGRPRPKLLFASDLYGFGGWGWNAAHWSFPSGHAATIAALMTALWWLWPRHLLFYLLVAAIVAASRVVVGAHYLSDVVAGAALGVAVTHLVARIFARWGIDLEAARHGRAVAAPASCRLSGGRLLGRRRV
jgi:lipid A 4'-phosphatase